VVIGIPALPRRIKLRITAITTVPGVPKTLNLDFRIIKAIIRVGED
jgi:hypothetical protein